MTIQRIAVLGAGGLGAAYGSQFLKAPEFETWFIARGDRYERLRRDGLIVNGEPIEAPVVHPDETVGSAGAQTAVPRTADLIIVALKHQHLAEAVPDLQRFVGPQTTIMSVMNGLDSEYTLGDHYGMEKVLYGMALGIDALREGNRIDYSAGGRIFFGDGANETLSKRVISVRDALEKAGIPYDIPVDMLRAMWRKFMINVGINQASAVLRAPYGIFQTNPQAQEIMESLMREAIATANAEGIDLNDGDLQGWYDFLNTLSPAGKTSMLQDVEAGRKTEVEIFGGKVIDLGHKHNIDTPVNRTIVNAIHVQERMAASSIQ